MPYCTTTDITSEFKGLVLSASTALTDTEVAGIITEEEIYINAKVSLKYLLPLVEGTSPKAWAIVKKITKFIVCDRVKDILVTRTGKAYAEQDSENKISKTSRAEKMLKEIISGDLPLEDATRANSTDGVASYSNTSDQEHTFKVGCEQW